MGDDFAKKLPLFEVCIVNGDNRIYLDVPYGGLENLCRSVLFHGNKVEIIGVDFKSID